ncbi:MAG TPA: DUF6178 family protein [Polyangiales bacterium]|nr:DUF6178 family protein [Polyangiales bacterium]
MGTLQRYLPPGQLLSHILERPAFVAAVRELPAAALSRLIDRVGLEDCSELVALASTEQLEAMFDEDLWRADASGVEERFDPRRFALWLQVMLEAGEEFLARKLCELPLELLTLAVNRLVLVIDMDALLNNLAGARDEAGQIERALENATSEEWEEFRIIARDVDAWEDVWNALLLLDREDHERLRAILEQCCAMSTEYINGQGSLYEVLTSDEMLESDALAERDDRRATQGYVSLGDARGFLELARQGGPPLAERDAISAAYFRALDGSGGSTRAAVAQRRLPGSAAGADVDGLMQLIAASDPTERGEKARALPGRSAAKSSGKRTKRAEPPPEQTPLAAALATLSSADPAAHTARMEELGYLANVLIAGCKHEGRKLRPIEALEAAIATCNLGLELWERPEPELLRRLGCDRLFRLAWPVLQQDLVQAAARILGQRCQQLDASRAHEAQKLIQNGDAFALRGVCQASELDLDDQALDVLLQLAEALPWQTPSDARRQPWIATLSDLERARRRLSTQRTG